MKSMSFICLLLVICLLPLGSGCGSSDGVGCTANIVDGIVVSVVDAVTHAPIAAGAVGTIQDGSFTGTLSPFSFDASGNTIALAGAQERTGTYTVRIEKTGYMPYVMPNVTVTKNVCHVNTVALTAQLQPAP